MENLMNEIKKTNDLINASTGGLEILGLSNEAYHHPETMGYSRSDLVLARRSPKHLAFKKKGLMQKDPTPALLFGSTFHDFVLENDVFWDRYFKAYDVPVPECNRRTKEGKAIYAEWKAGEDDYLASNDGKTLVKEDDLEVFGAMRSAMMEIPVVSSIFTEGSGFEFENTYFYKCPYSGQMMKFRPDIINKERKIMLDLKTTTDASPNSFRKSMANFYYDLQAAQYTIGAKEIFGGDWTFGFIVVEKTAPYGVALYTAGDAEMEMGTEIYKDSVKLLSVDPTFAYGDEFTDIGLPAWGFDISYR